MFGVAAGGISMSQVSRHTTCSNDISNIIEHAIDIKINSISIRKIY